MSTVLPAISTPEQVVQLLRALIKEHHYEKEFDEAIASLQQYTDIEPIKPGFKKLSDIKNLDDLCNWLVAYLKVVPAENDTSTAIYDYLCQSYFIFDQPSLKVLQNEILPREKTAENKPFSQWMRAFVEYNGKFMDMPESITPESYQTFVDSPNYTMQDYIVPPEGFKTFNQFFYRNVKPDCRPIAAPDDDTIIISPVDSSFEGVWPIDSRCKIDSENNTSIPKQQLPKVVKVKGLEWSIHQLLEGSKYHESFNGGVFSHSFLKPWNYHRLHVPVSGTVLEARVVTAQVYIDIIYVEGTGTLFWNSTHACPNVARYANAARALIDRQAKSGELVNPNEVGYQFGQTRGILVLETKIGKVAVMPIGMSQISSCVFTVKEGDVVKKGQEFGYFQFGGSDYIILFEAKANVAFSAVPPETYLMGAEIARAAPK